MVTEFFMGSKPQCLGEIALTAFINGTLRSRPIRAEKLKIFMTKEFKSVADMVASHELWTTEI
jgi:hypothetical protein